MRSALLLSIGLSLLGFSAIAAEENPQVNTQVAEIVLTKSPKNPNKLNVTMSTYYWATDLNSTSTDAKNNSVSLNLDPSSVSKTTDNWATFDVKIEKNNWVVDMQTSYQDASGQETVIMTPYGELPLDISSKTTVVEIWVGRRFGKQSAWVDLYVGGRYLKSDSIYKTDFGTENDSVSWTEPLIGLEANYMVGENTAIYYKGSVGNFNNDSNLSHDNAAGVLYRFGKRYAVIAGYRQQELNNHDNGNTLKAAFKGPFFAIAVRF